MGLTGQVTPGPPGLQAALVSLRDVPVDSVVKCELDNGIIVGGFAARRELASGSAAAEGEDLPCCDSKLRGAARE